MGVLLLPKVGIEINQAMKIDSYLLEKTPLLILMKTILFQEINKEM